MDNNLKVVDMPIQERPIERLITFGPETLSDSELLAIILRCGVRGENVLNLSQRVLNKVNGIDGILNASYSDLTSIKGVKSVKASQIIAISELFRRLSTLRSKSNIINISKPSDVGEMLMTEMASLNQEVLKVIILNTKNNVIRVKDIFKGTLNSSIVHPREIFNEAIKSGGASIIICHNHPSGDPTPSKEDINITIRIKECGKIVGIDLLDHIIVGHREIVSLKEKGII